MKLELSKSFTHSCGNKNNSQYSEEELKNILLKLIQKNGIDPKLVNVSKDGILSIQDSPNIKLHSIMLQAEEMGLEMKYTKKTLIEIC